MTYWISIQGHGDEPYEERKATEEKLLTGLVKALEADGGNVTEFEFHGNEVTANSWDEAKTIVQEPA